MSSEAVGVAPIPQREVPSIIDCQQLSLTDTQHSFVPHWKPQLQAAGVATEGKTQSTASPCQVFSKGRHRSGHRSLVFTDILQNKQK